MRGTAEKAPLSSRSSFSTAWPRPSPSTSPRAAPSRPFSPTTAPLIAAAISGLVCAQGGIRHKRALPAGPTRPPARSSGSTAPCSRSGPYVWVYRSDAARNHAPDRLAPPLQPPSGPHCSPGRHTDEPCHQPPGQTHTRPLPDSHGRCMLRYCRCAPAPAGSRAATMTAWCRE